MMNSTGCSRISLAEFPGLRSHGGRHLPDQMQLLRASPGGNALTSLYPVVLHSGHRGPLRPLEYESAFASPGELEAMGVLVAQWVTSGCPSSLTPSEGGLPHGLSLGSSSHAVTVLPGVSGRGGKFWLNLGTVLEGTPGWALLGCLVIHTPPPPQTL